MWKVFLAEDEKIIRNGIKKSVDWEQAGCRFVGEASDGQTAFPIIQELKPDILITDIRMPFMDGLELSAKVKNEFPRIKIIILSGYNDFKYAQEAIRLGVSEYLLKPVSAKMLLKAVKKVTDELTKERTKDKVPEDFLFHDMSFDEFIETGDILECDSTHSYYQVILFKLMPVKDSDDYVKQSVFCHRKVDKELKSIAGVRSFARGMDEWGIILSADSRDDIYRIADILEKNIMEIMQGYREIEWFAGQGVIADHLQQISGSYETASKAFAARFFTKANQILPYQKIDNLQTEDNLKPDMNIVDPSKISQCVVDNFLKSGVKEEINGFVDEYIRSIGEYNFRSTLFRQYAVMSCYLAVCNFMESIGGSTEETDDFYSIVKDKNTMEEIRKYLCRLFQDALEYREIRSARKHGDCLDIAIEFIDKNYANQELTLNLLADVVNISPNYFSRIFSKNEGCTFVEYLTNIRINKAKELLMCSNMKTTNIAYEIGYKDSHYFSCLFKKLTGCTPKEYRERSRRA